MQKNFGFQEIRKFEKPALELKGSVMKLEDFVLEILQPYSSLETETRNPELKALLKKQGANHFAISVEDLKLAYTNLVENNVKIIAQDAKYVFCQDNDGTLIEVRQR